MAQKATIYKASLSIADMDRHYYEDHSLTIARHPSETDERMMLRILAFSMIAHERLQFTKGLSSEDEPDLWQKSLSDEIEMWVELGHPSEKRIRQACGKSNECIVIGYGGNVADSWWDSIKNKVQRFKNLKVLNIAPDIVQNLSEFSKRSMSLQVTIQENDIMVSDNENSIHISPMTWKEFNS